LNPRKQRRETGPDLGHDYLDPQIARLFQGVDHILHAGDIGMPALLLELGLIAPVTAVAGNTDDPTFGYRQTRLVDLSGRKFLIHHIVDPHDLRAEVKSLIAKERPEVVLFGHTHKPFCERVNGTLFFNPGYAGRQRFDLPRTVAVMHGDGREFRHEFLSL
jgi:putative phosphoesterase